MINDKLPKIWYGGDYNPEQWDAPAWAEDERMFKLAGIDVTTINVFSWAMLQPDEDTYDFSFLDAQMDRLYKSGTYVCLATATGAHPAWMARKYPEVTQVDVKGRKRQFGGRHNSNMNSPIYRKFAARLASKLAERYKDHPALVAWHINNEISNYDYSELSAVAFREWLKKRYGSLDVVNKVWNTRFWGHTFYDWDEIVLPSELSEEWDGNNTNFQGISLDFRRFMNDAHLECYLLEYNAIKEHCQNVPITTNLMGFYPGLNYFEWAEHLDVISWDNYPALDTPVSFTAMSHDLMRGLKSGQPFMLMEQTPSQQNWQPYNSLKRPGVMRLWSYQAVAHGADTVLFFQLRRSVGACEKYHGAVIEHVGHEHTRVFRETAELGRELQQLGDELLDARGEAKVGILYDWENRWAVELSSGPSVGLDYVNEIHKYYDALYQENIEADMIGLKEDFSKYKVIIAPVLYMLKPGVKEKIEAFVKAGGTFVTTYFSGIVNENDIVTLGGYPGELRNLLGIWAEEIDSLLPEMSNEIVMEKSWGELNGSYKCNLLCDLIHSEGAEVLARYGSDFYKGMPVLTANSFGEGKAYYVATSPDANFLRGFLGNLCAEQDVLPLVTAPEGIESVQRVKNGVSYLFLLNHTNGELSADIGSTERTDLLTGQKLSGTAVVPGHGVLILSDKK